MNTTLNDFDQYSNKVNLMTETMGNEQDDDDDE